MMDFGLTLLTHGIMTRDLNGDGMLQPLPASEMNPIGSSIRAETLGFHSVWLSDHVVTERTSEGIHTANSSGKRAYPDRPDLLDVPTTMAAIAATTSTIRMSPSVHIAPYRHPLTTAHQIATIDVLSNGRAMLAVGVGWELGEFAALDVSFEQRGSITEESIQIYKEAWTEPWISFEGKHFNISDVSMDPKPIQKPHPPIWYGGLTPIAAKRAARHCTGLYPMFLDTHGHPSRMDHLREEVLREAERIGRDITGFQLGGFCSVRICDTEEISSRFGGRRPLLAGSPQQILEDLQVFADFGYSHITTHLDCPSGTVAEWNEQMEQWATEIIAFEQELDVNQKF